MLIFITILLNTDKNRVLYLVLNSIKKCKLLEKMWRRERNRPRALLNGQFYEEERKLADMLAADLRFVCKKLKLSF